MTAAERLAVLATVPAFSLLPAGEVRRLATASAEYEVAAGEVLAREGALGPQSFVVLSGTASVASGGQTVAHLGPGSFIGDIAARRMPRAATVTAQTTMRVLVIGPASLERLRAAGCVDDKPTRGAGQ